MACSWHPLASFLPIIGVMILTNHNTALLINKARLEHQMKAEFSQFILQSAHPCLMARSIFKSDHVDFHAYEQFGSKHTAEQILSHLKNFIANYDFESGNYFTFIAAFKDKKNYSEKEFEKLLWKQLQYLHEADDMPWDETVSPDPENENFSFSLGGRAFYIVGLHTDSSRLSRQSPFPAMVFNLHLQFEKLRERGHYQGVKKKIRGRDKALQGNINPMLEDFGHSSEAKQYSDRNVGNKWKCPFHHK